MSDEINNKVIKMFNRHNNDLPQDSDEKIKFFAGFNYVKLKRDENGKKFIPAQLEAYSKKCHYIVTIMKNVDNETCLYNYDIKSDDIPEFMQALQNGVLTGKLIEIKKYIPEELA